MSIDQEKTSQVVLSLPHGPDNARNSEGAFIALDDGRIMFVYTRFVGDDYHDHAQADLVARFSSDQGRTWTDHDTPIVANEGHCNIMSVSLLRLQDGRIALFYLLKNNALDCRLHMRLSGDECSSWSDPLCCIPAPGYHVVNNDRVIQLKSGRLVVPAALHRAKRAPGDTASLDIDSRAITLFFLSDDNGASWFESCNWLALPQSSGSGLQEPGAVELGDGSLYAWARSDTGRQWEMRSSDGAMNWSQASESRFVSPCSPLSIKRAPATGRLLAIWNDISDRPGEGGQHSGGRTPLTAAISVDEGRSWSRTCSIETDPEHGYCYTAMHFTDDSVLLAYCCGGGAGDAHSHVLQDLRVRRVSLEWLYRQTTGARCPSAQP